MVTKANKFVLQSSSIKTAGLRVCLDTNVLVSAAVFGGNCARIVEMVGKKQLENVISFHIISEFSKVLEKKLELDEFEIKKVLRPIIKSSNIIETKRNLEVLSYGPDNRILECAVVGEADYIITGDKKHLLKLNEYEGIKIVSPREFLKAIANVK